PLRGHVEDVPDRPDGVDVATVLALIARREHELRGPRVTELVAVAHEHVEDRDLLSLHYLGVVVAVVTVVLRGEKPQVSPGALPGEGADPLGIRLRDHREVEPMQSSIEKAEPWTFTKFRRR